MVVVAEQSHHPLFVIVEGVVVRVLVLKLVWPAGVKGFAGAQVSADARDLRLLLEIIDGVENAMVQVQLHRLAIRKDPPELFVKMRPLVVTPEIVRHDKASVEEVLPQGRGFFVRQNHPTCRGKVNERIIGQILRRNIDEMQAWPDLEAGHLMKPEDQVQIRLRRVVIPQPAPAKPVTAVSLKLEPRESEDVL